MAIEVTDVVTVDGHPHDVPLLSEQCGTDQLRNTQSGEGDDSGPAIGFEIEERPTGPRHGDETFDETDACARIDPLDTVGVGLDAAQDPFDRPTNGGHGGDAEALIDRSTALVVDASDDAFHVEELSSGTGDEDVGVVAVGHRSEGIGALDARGTQTRAIETDADDGVAAEVLRETTERCRLAIDHRHGVSLFDQCGGETGTDSTASDDDDVHFAPPPGVRMDTAIDPMTERWTPKTDRDPVQMGVMERPGSMIPDHRPATGPDRGSTRP